MRRNQWYLAIYFLAFPREKRAKGCMARIVQNHSAFKKWKSDRRRDDLCAVGLRKYASLFISLCIRDFD